MVINHLLTGMVLQVGREVQNRSHLNICETEGSNKNLSFFWDYSPDK